MKHIPGTHVSDNTTKGNYQRKKKDVRPVTMEGQRFEIPEDPSQALPERSLMDLIWCNYIFKLSIIPGKKHFSRRSWPTSA